MIFFDLFITFLKIGAFSFGGGYAMISLISEAVLKHNWMTEDEILNFVEEFDVKELATLSVAELNHIGEVLGVEPKILLGETD